MSPVAGFAVRRGRHTARNPLLDPRRGDVVVFLHAHPDDESIFTGGTIARLAEAGASAVLVTATLGELGRPNDPLVRADLGDDVPIATLRGDELRRAGAVLGVTQQVFLGGEGRFTDSGFDASGWADDCLTRNVDAAATELIALLRRVRPHALVTYDGDGCTGHPDHLTCHAVGVRAAAALSVLDDCLAGLAFIADPLPLRRPRRRDGPGVAVDTVTVRTRKATAVGCHFSQVGDGFDDPARLRAFDRGSAVARYLPHVLSTRPRARHERYAWVAARELRRQTRRRTASELLNSQPVRR